jgi:DNA processing protein
MPFMGPAKLKMLLAHFKSLENAWRSGIDDLLASGIENKTVLRMIDFKKNISPEKEYEKLAEENIELVTFKDERFPNLLLEISSSPAMIYLKGSLSNSDICLAVVGSRKLSPYGTQAASFLSKELSASGLTLVSGLAFGADTVAHLECVKQKKRTIAVLGGGLDEKSIYPLSNRKLARDISGSGALISEYPIGTPPLKQHFPARNRIISGLSKGVLVIEASESSGSLITAKFSLEQNRDVFAVPGSIFSGNSIGTNNLIKLGAKLASRPRDILEELDIETSLDASKLKDIIPDNDDEKLILENLARDNATHIDQLSKNIKMNMNSLSSLLTLMEIKGKVKNIGGMRYIIAN